MIYVIFNLEDPPWWLEDPLVKHIVAWGASIQSLSPRMTRPVCEGRAEKGKRQWQAPVPCGSWAPVQGSRVLLPVREHAKRGQICHLRRGEITRGERREGGMWSSLQFFFYGKFLTCEIWKLLCSRFLFLGTKLTLNLDWPWIYCIKRFLLPFSEYCFMVSARITEKSAYMP